MRKTLFTGLDPTYFDLGKSCLHVPLIEIIPRPLDNKEIQTMFSHLSDFTHCIFTSKNSVRIFFSYLEKIEKTLADISHINILSIGKRTTFELTKVGVEKLRTADEESQEGIIELLAYMPLKNAFILMPRSSIARANLTHYLVEHSIRHFHCDLYDTIYKEPQERIPFEEVKEIVFTSPSTVNAFFTFYQKLPDHIKVKCIGNVTRHALQQYVK